MFSCIIFDFDGTLVNLGKYVNWGRACRRIVDLYLRGGMPRDVVQRYSRDPLSLMANTYDALFETFPMEKALKILEEASRILEVEEFEGSSKATVVPDCEKVLHWLRRQGVHVGVVSSNSGRIVSYLLKRLKLKGFVENVVGRESRLKLKPHPDQVHLCLAGIGCPKENAALVAVDEDGIRAAKASGIHVIVILSGSRHSIASLLDAKTDSIVENFQDLLSLFQQL